MVKGCISHCCGLALNKETVTDFFQMMASLFLHLLSACPLWLLFLVLEQFLPETLFDVVWCVGLMSRVVS